MAHTTSTLALTEHSVQMTPCIPSIQIGANNSIDEVVPLQSFGTQSALEQNELPPPHSPERRTVPLRTSSSIQTLAQDTIEGPYQSEGYTCQESPSRYSTSTYHIFVDI